MASYKLWAFPPNYNGKTGVDWSWVGCGETEDNCARLWKHGRKWAFGVELQVGEIRVIYESPAAYNGKRNAYAGLKNWLEGLVDGGDPWTNTFSIGDNWAFVVDWNNPAVQMGDAQTYSSPYCYDSKRTAETGAERFTKNLKAVARGIAHG